MERIMTRQQYANTYVDTWCEKNGVDRSKVTSWGNHMLSSGCLAVCLEYLDLLTNEQKAYSRSRGGVIKVTKDNNGCPAVYTMRDLLNELPDEKANPESLIMKGVSTTDLINMLKNNGPIASYYISVNGYKIRRIDIDHEHQIVNIVSN